MAKANGISVLNNPEHGVKVVSHSKRSTDVSITEYDVEFLKYTRVTSVPNGEYFFVSPNMVIEGEDAVERN